jgi:hypothetical protein
LKEIQAFGDLKNPEVIRLDKELRTRGIEPIWNSASLRDAQVVLLCVTTHIDLEEWTSMLRLALHECYNKKILMALFKDGVKPAILGDLKAADFTTNWQNAFSALTQGIDHFIA